MDQFNCTGRSDTSECCDNDSKECKHDIVCSQAKIAECEARLFCTVTDRLSCEIKHAHCLKDIERLIRIANSFFLASAQKEKAIGEVIGSCKKEAMTDI